MYIYVDQRENQIRTPLVLLIQAHNPLYRMKYPMMRLRVTLQVFQ